MRDLRPLGQVFYTVGNHELWFLNDDKSNGCKDSLDKLFAILQAWHGMAC